MLSRDIRQTWCLLAKLSSQADADSIVSTGVESGIAVQSSIDQCSLWVQF